MEVSTYMAYSSSILYNLCHCICTKHLIPSIPTSNICEFMATKNEGETLYQFLKNRNLEKYFAKFQEQGAEDVKDVLDGIDKEVLTQDIGMKPLEANKFLKMIEEYKVRQFIIRAGNIKQLLMANS